MKVNNNNKMAIRMAMALILGLAVGIGCLLLRENLIRNGNAHIWAKINNILFQDISVESTTNLLLVIVNIIPSNITSVFSNNINILAVVTGLCINILGNKIKMLRNLLENNNPSAINEENINKNFKRLSKSPPI